MNTNTRPFRRIAVLILCLPAILAATAASAAAATPTAAHRPSSCRHVLFHDNFSRTPDHAWTFYNRRGEIRAGRLWIDGGYEPGAFGRDGWAFTHVGDARWRDYSVTATYDSANVGGFPSEAHMAFLYFRVKQSGTTGYDTAYRLAIWDPGQPDPTTGGIGTIPHGLLQLTRYVNGVGTILKEVRRSRTHVGINHVTIVTSGAKILVWADGRQVLSFVDPTPIHSGGVGVGQIWETNGWFDNVLVRGRA